MEKSAASDNFSATVIRGASDAEVASIEGYYTAQCFDVDGNLKWEEDFPNAITQEGKKWMLDQLQTGQATVNSRMYLYIGGTASTTSTYASPQVTEATLTAVSATGRQTPSWSAATDTNVTVATKATSAAVFSIATTCTVSGAAVAVINAAVGNMATVADTGTAGAKIYSVGAFGAAKACTAGDVINVTYSTQLVG